MYFQVRWSSSFYGCQRAPRKLICFGLSGFKKQFVAKKAADCKQSFCSSSRKIGRDLWISFGVWVKRVFTWSTTDSKACSWRLKYRLGHYAIVGVQLRMENLEPRLRSPIVKELVASTGRTRNEKQSYRKIFRTTTGTRTSRSRSCTYWARRCAVCKPEGSISLA